MRICRIRGRNLASLAGDFEVDLEAPPLAGTGLFAIVGDTGAGKSTLLDALCLALYGTFPRIEARGSREEIADVGAATMASNDPATILRRGATEGSAEVDLIVDGERLRATWSLRRAHKRATGSLQAPTRSLVRVADGQVLASGIKPVATQIERRLGLTYAQFTRTVLLAQGEFDAFLRADDKDRSDLLQKITSTEIFERISKRTFESTRAIAQRKDELEIRRKDIAALDANARTALDDKLAACAACSQQLDAKRVEAAAADAWHLKSADLAQRWTQASQALAQARTEVAAASSHRTRLAVLHRADSVRLAIAEARAAQVAHAKADQHATAAANAHLAVEQRLAAARSAATVADLEHRQALKMRSDAEAPLTLAAALDTKIAGAAAEVETATAAVEAAHARRLASEAACTELEAARTEALRRAHAHQAELEARRGLADLAQREDAVLVRVRALADTVQRLALVGRETDALTARNAAHQHQRAVAGNRAAAAIESIAIRSGEVAALRLRLDALAPTTSRTRCDVAISALYAGSRLARGLDAMAAARARAASAVADMAAAQASEGTGRQRVAALHAELARKRIRLDEAERATALVERALAPEVLALRVGLVDGAPCPVCGSAAHPGHGDGLEVVVAEQRRHVGVLRADMTTAEQALTAASTETAAAAAQCREAERAKAAADVEIERETADTARHHATLATALGPLGEVTPPLDTGDWAALSTRVRALLARLEAERARLATALADAAAIDSEIAERDAALAEVRRQEASATAVCRALDAEATALAEHTAERRGQGSALVAERDRQRTELQSVLAATGLDVDDLVRDHAAFEQRLREKIADFRDCAAELARIRAEILTLEHDVLRATVDLHNANDAHTAAVAGQAARQRSCDELRAQRAGLIGGEATALYRARLDAALAVAAARHGAADVELHAAEVEQGAIAQFAAASVATAQAAAIHMAQQLAARDAALTIAALTLQEADAALAVDASVRTALAARLGALDAAVAAATALDSDRANAAEAHAQADKPDLDATAAHARLQAAEAACRENAELLGRLSQQRDDDDAQLSRAGALLAEIAAVDLDHAVWAAVNDAIGAADGARFRRYVQGITLAHLVALANAQLARLNPRYQLARVSKADLGLLVVDRDMGGEARSIRSLSGGERFLASLALALSLASLEGRSSFVDTLFIDEGFGALDSRSLDLAIGALEALQSQGRKVGIISHIDSLTERVPVQVRVEKQGNGRSRVRVVDRWALPA